MESIAIRDSVSLHHAVDGPDTAPPLLLCHALGTSRELWQPQLTRFTRNFRTIRYDARGHGQSPAAGAEATLDNLGGDALAVLDAAGITSAHIVGISLGGLTALWLAIHAPHRVQGLALASTAARIGTVTRWSERIATVRADGMHAIAEMTMPVWFSAPFREREPATVESFRRRLAASSSDGYVACCGALRDADLTQAVGGIDAPTLIIAGDADPATTVADARDLQRRIRGATLTTLDAAHLSNVEQPDHFADCVEAFIVSSRG